MVPNKQGNALNAQDLVYLEQFLGLFRWFEFMVGHTLLQGASGAQHFPLRVGIHIGSPGWLVPPPCWLL